MPRIPGELMRRLSVDPETRDKLDQTMAAIAAQTGATLHTYPRPGRAVRRVVLRDTHDDRGTQSEAAQIKDDGTLRVAGHGTGVRVSDIFGAAITSYEWVYVVPVRRVTALAQALGAEHGDDVLDALASYYQQHDGRISKLLRSPEIAAEFDNWPS
jgi:hypothetical protein